MAHSSFSFSKGYFVLIKLILYADVALISVYLLFRAEWNRILVDTITYFLSGTIFDQTAGLFWSFLLFATCASSAILRQIQFKTEINNSKGIIYFELMVFFAIALSLKKYFDIQVPIDPFWPSKITYSNYMLAVITTAGSAYIFSDFWSRICNILSKT